MSSYDCPTVYISMFLDIILSPLVQELPSFMKYTPQILQIINDFELPANANHMPRLFTMDVYSLFTSIPQDGALNTSKHFLGKRSSNSMSTFTLLQFIELVPKMNTLHFNGRYFSQKKVTPWEPKWDTWKNCFLLSMNTPQQCYASDILTTSLELPYVLKKNYNDSLIM